MKARVLGSATNTQEIDHNLSIGISPNPVKEILYFKTHLNINKIEIFDALGRSIQSENISENKINVAHLANGIYFAEIKTKSGIQISKIIIQK
mgnify:CR=1 FL=1